MKKTLPTLAVIASLLYVVAELIYNLGLVEFLTSKNTEVSTFDSLETFGKALSSIGLSLALLNLVKNPRHKLVAFLLMVPALYTAETVGFDKFVRSLSPEVKVAGYVSAVYRNAVLNGNLEDERFSQLTPYNRVMLSNIMSLTTDKAKMEQQVSKLLYKSLDSAEVRKLYASYENLTAAIDPYYATYAIESKRWDGYKGKTQELIDREFMARSSGLKQGLNKAQFLAAVAERSPSFKAFQDTVIVPGNAELGIVALTGKDLPLGMDETTFKNFVQHKYADVVSKSQISTATVEKLPHAYDLISSVFVPPLAIGLSLLSILLNTGLLLTKVGERVRRPYSRPVAVLLMCVPALIAVAAFATSTYNPYKVQDTLNRAMSVEATLYSQFEPVARAIHMVAINDKNPIEANIIRIKAPEPINFKDLEEKMLALKQSSQATDMPQIDERLKADSEKIQSDRSYYGEIRTSSNPYLKN